MDKYLESIKNNELPIITFRSFEKFDGVTHGFTTRLGGVSKGIFSSMNLSFQRGDNYEDVMKNYEIIADYIGYPVNKFVASHQTHTTNIRVVTENDCGKGIIFERDYEDIDGLVTNVPGIVLFTYYADCVPLYFFDEKNRVIALAHSGWKGTVGKIGKVMVEKMCAEFGSRPDDIFCAIGPSICQNCYEVSGDVAEEFMRNFSENEWKSFIKDGRPGKYQLNLWEANRKIFLEAGILEAHIENREICTCCNKERLFSHRGLNGKRGNLAAFMALDR